MTFPQYPLEAGYCCCSKPHSELFQQSYDPNKLYKLPIKHISKPEFRLIALIPNTTAVYVNDIYANGWS